MRLIKLALLSIVFLFLAATAVSLLIPGHIRISKAVNVHASKDSLLSLVGKRSNWPLWHPAFQPGDSAPHFEAIDTRVIAQNDSEVVMELRQGKKPPVVNGWKIYGHPGSDSLTLQWYMDFHPKWYPWQKFGSLFYENTYGVMMEQGLEHIKKLVEQ